MLVLTNARVSSASTSSANIRRVRERAHVARSLGSHLITIEVVTVDLLTRVRDTRHA